MEVAGESVGADLCVGPNTFCCGSRSRADTQVRPYAGWKVFRTTQASGAQRSVCGAGARKWVGIAAEIIPKGASNLGQSLSQPAADSSLCTREPLGTGDADCRVASLLAMTVLNLCHSEEAQRADVGIRSFLRWTGVRAAESSAPTGGCGKPPATAGAALSEAESAERAAGQIRFLPDDLRVQHGAQRSEVSAKLRPCSRRDCDN